MKMKQDIIIFSIVIIIGRAGHKTATQPNLKKKIKKIIIWVIYNGHAD